MPYSPLKVNHRFGGTGVFFMFVICFMLLSCLAYFSTEDRVQMFLQNGQLSMTYMVLNSKILCQQGAKVSVEDFIFIIDEVIEAEQMPHCSK
jgi:hypothetical protein